MPRESNSTRLHYASHPRRWRDFVYVYPVISRRSKGLSIGINLSRDQACDFDCVYCQVDRAQPPDAGTVSFHILEAELRQLLADPAQIFQDEQLRDVPPDRRNVMDIAFSGDGEPTLSPAFPAAVGLVAEIKAQCRLDNAKIVVLTNAAHLRRATVIQTLAFLDAHNGEIWAKLDAGTQEQFERVNGVHHSLDQIMQNLLVTGRVRPIVIQSLFMRIDGEPPGSGEIAAYVGRLRWLLDGGARFKLVQVYTVARRPAQDRVSRLTAEELESIAEAVRPLGIPVEVYA